MHNYTIILHILGGRTLKFRITHSGTFEELISSLDSAGWYLFDDTDGKGFTRINAANVLYMSVREEIEADDDGK